MNIRVAGNDGQVGDRPQRDHALLHRSLVRVVEHVEQRCLRGFLIVFLKADRVSDPLREIDLRIQVNDENLQSVQRQVRGDLTGERGLARASLVVEDRDGPGLCRVRHSCSFRLLSSIAVYFDIAIATPTDPLIGRANHPPIGRAIATSLHRASYHDIHP